MLNKRVVLIWVVLLIFFLVKPTGEGKVYAERCRKACSFIYDIEDSEWYKKAEQCFTDCMPEFTSDNK